MTTNDDPVTNAGAPLLLAALRALPRKRLCRGELTRDGEFCALGAVIVYREGIPALAEVGASRARRMALRQGPYPVRYITGTNDITPRGGGTETPEQTYERMYRWAQDLATAEVPDAPQASSE